MKYDSLAVIDFYTLRFQNFNQRFSEGEMNMSKATAYCDQHFNFVDYFMYFKKYIPCVGDAMAVGKIGQSQYTRGTRPISLLQRASLPD